MNDVEELAHAISRVLKRIADKGWIASTVIRPGKLHIEYTALGKKRMGALKKIFVDELHITLKPVEFRALIGLLLEFES